MVKKNNLGVVIKFEIVRNLKKRSFWLAAILMPVLLGGYIFIAGMNGAGMESTISAGTDTSEMSLGLVDEAGLVDSGDFAEVADRDTGVAEVKNGELDVLYVVPEGFAEDPRVEIYARTDRANLFVNYELPIRTALLESATARIAVEDLAIATNTYTVETVSFGADGEVDDVLGRMVVPIAALGLFYILICMFGNRLMMATVEEKENRITEMLLTSMSPTTLVLGKIVSLIVLGLVQLLVLAVPVIIFYLYATSQGMISFALDIDWNVLTVLSSLSLLVLSYFLFTGLSVAVGALVPTAKELAPYASIFMILVIMPLFSLSSFIAAEPTAFTYFLSYFPLSAPVALMLRNAFGVLPVWELVLGLGVLALSAGLALWLAVYIFKRSAMDFTTKLSVRALLVKGPRRDWGGRGGK